MLAKILPFTETKQKTDYYFYADEIPLLEVLKDGKTIVTKEGHLLQVIKLSGIDYTCLTEEDNINHYNLRHNFLKKIDSNFSYCFHSIRKKAGKLTLTNNSENPYLKEIVDLSLKRVGEVYIQQDYIVISVLARKGKSINLLDIERSTISLNEKVTEVINYFNYIAPKILNVNNELLNFWKDYVNGSSDYLNPLKRENNLVDLGYKLGLTNVEMDPFTGVITYEDKDKNEKRYCKYVVIKELSKEIYSWMFTKLNEMPIEYNLYQIVKGLNKEKTLKEIESRQGKLAMIKRFAQTSVMELEEIGEKVSFDELNIPKQTFTLRIKASSQEDLDNSYSQVRALFNQFGIDITFETLNIKAAFFGVYPDFYESLVKARGREVTSMNVASSINFIASDHGFTKCDFGNEPVAYFRTPGNSYYGFIFHDSDEEKVKGHTLIFGSSGRGKTTLITYLLLNCLKYKDLRILGFDSKSGMKIFTEAFDGAYSDPINDKIKLNPFSLPDSMKNRAFLENFLVSLAGNVTDQQANVIRKNVSDFYNAKHSDVITLSKALVSFISNEKDSSSLKSKLSKWTKEYTAHNDSNVFASLFDNKEDDLAFQKRIVCFDMDEALKDEKIIEPLATYIFHAFMDYTQRENVPFVCVIDELHKFITHPLFARFIDIAVREWRKVTGAIIGVIQDVKTVIETPAGQSFINNMATAIFFPNSSAKDQKKYYIESLGLNESEFNWIVNCTEPYQVLVKKKESGKSVILDVNLSHLGKNLKLLSSQKDNVEAMKSYKQQYPDNWIEKYLGE
ncbi:MAG: hypothetical protein J0H68_09665 [Sphingobacteriia bacterium]|nr:hypothetical protein [Sphingobacteriia bacterium]